MSAEATLVKDNCNVDQLAYSTGYASGEVIQLADGRAAVKAGLAAAASGDPTAFQTEGQFDLPKTASINILDGQKVFWDHSANTATYTDLGNDRDFLLGVAVGDSLAPATSVRVNLNVKPRPIIDLAVSPFASIPVAAAGISLLMNRVQGGSAHFGWALTAEAEKLDLLSVRSFPVESKWIFEGILTVVADADADVTDVSFGVADGTHATDADSIANSAFAHLNLSGADLKIYAESDNVAAEVAATDTTKVFVVGTPFHLVIDGRNSAALKFYINGVAVLASTAFTLSGATGPLKALFHMEKTSNDAPSEVRCDEMTVRIMQQSNAA